MQLQFEFLKEILIKETQWLAVDWWFYKSYDNKLVYTACNNKGKISKYVCNIEYS